MQRKHWLFVILAVLIVFSLACSAVTGQPQDAPATLPTPVERMEIATPTSVDVAPPAPTPVPTQPVDAPEPTPTPIAGPEETEPARTTTYDTEFPLPDNVQNFMVIADTVNYQTSMPLDDLLAFYRAEFTAQGLEENTLLTVVSADLFSIVFTGASNGQDVVVQAVDLGSGTVNVNVRYEDL